MRPKMVQKKSRGLDDPILDYPGYNRTESIVGIWGHPLHAMTVAFPVALTFCAFGADMLYFWSGELFWARAAIWAAGTAFLEGVAALPDFDSTPSLCGKAAKSFLEGLDGF